MAVRFLTVGDCAVSAEFGSIISPEIGGRIRALVKALEAAPIEGITEAVPSYRALMVNYDPAVISHDELIAKLEARLSGLPEVSSSAIEIVDIPVLYGGEEGPDLAYVAEHAGLTEAEVIEIHSSPDYLVYMLGFTPGFPYLGGMDPRIATPRLKKPRVRIPGGSVGIAGAQTGVYPIDSPGGWQLIGRTPLKLYDPAREEPFLAQAGKYIHFRPIDRKEYEELLHAGAEGSISL